MLERSAGNTDLRLVLPQPASAADVSEAFRRIGAQCRSGGAARALVIAGELSVSRPELRAAIVGLAEVGCPFGFRLACVASLKDTFEDLVSAEDAGIRSGIVTRVFFDEENATRWLNW